jgi:hypothetical protein
VSLILAGLASLVMGAAGVLIPDMIIHRAWRRRMLAKYGTVAPTWFQIWRL